MMTNVASRLVSIASTLGEVAFTLVSGIVRGILSGLIDGWTSGLLTLYTFITESGPIIVDGLTTFGAYFLTAIHNMGTMLVNMLEQDLGPGGNVRRMATVIADFVAWLASKAASWTIDIVDGAISGFIEATGDGQRIRKIALSLQLLFLTAKDNLLTYLGIPDFKAIGVKICMSIFEGVLEKAETIMDSEIGRALNDVIEEFTGYDLAGTLNSWSVRANSVLGSIDTSGARQRANDIAMVREAIEDVNRALDGSAGNIDEDYKGVAASASRAANSSDSFFSTILGGLRDLIGISDDFSISDLIGDIASSFGEGLGEGLGSSGIDLSSILGSLGGISDAAGSIDLSGMLGVDTTQLSGASLELGNIDSMLSSEEFTNPVIAPEVDTSGVELGIANIEDMFNNANISEFALDVGNSMTVREQAEGDAATSGDVSYNFTQYNYSPEPLSRTQIYLDSRNLIRGSV